MCQGLPSLYYCRVQCWIKEYILYIKVEYNGNKTLGYEPNLWFLNSHLHHYGDTKQYSNYQVTIENQAGLRFSTTNSLCDVAQ